jgi:hypothetical protein
MFHDLRLPLLNGRGRLTTVLAMIRQFCAAVVVGATGQVAIAESAPYVPYSGIIRGTEGAVAVALTLRNGTSGDIRCQAALAHWYSVDLVGIAAGGSLGVALWHDPATGRLDLLNPLQDRMPVEAIWCGKTGHVHDTRARVALPFLIGTSPTALDRVCSEGVGGRLACTGED